MASCCSHLILPDPRRKRARRRAGVLLVAGVALAAYGVAGHHEPLDVVGGIVAIVAMLYYGLAGLLYGGRTVGDACGETAAP